MPELITSTYPRRSDYWLKHETDMQTGRESGTLAALQGKVDTGTVLGRVSIGAASAAAKSGGNTGDGALTLDAVTPVLNGAQVGVYTVRCVTAASDGGVFEVQDPQGDVIGSVAVGETWAEGVKFAIADGAADFIVGDGFDITVAEGGGLWKVCKKDAIDGSQKPAGVLYRYADASTAAKSIVIVTGGAEVVMAEMIFDPTHATLADKRAVMAALSQLGIRNRAVA